MYQGWVKATFEFQYKSKIQFNSFCLQCEYCMYALKRIGKIILENAFEQKKKNKLKFKRGLALNNLQTTGPRIWVYATIVLLKSHCWFAN